MPATPRRKRGDDLLPPALALLRREGPDSITMRNVAREAGVTAAALYRHFADKDALVQEIVREVYSRFRAALDADPEDADPKDGDPLSALRSASLRFLRFGLHNPNYYRLLFAHPHGFGIDRYPDDFRSRGSRGFRRLREVVARGMRDGVLAGDPSSDAGDVALTLYAHMHGLVMLSLAGRFPDRGEFEAFYATSFDRLLRGIGA
ncbi:MAG: TetR/AcrR family transcriptional regulator [Gemmatimonadota bacterium]